MLIVHARQAPNRWQTQANYHRERALECSGARIGSEGKRLNAYTNSHLIKSSELIHFVKGQSPRWRPGGFFTV